MGLIVYFVIETMCSPILINNQDSNENLSPSRKLINREFSSLLTHQERKRIARAVTDPIDNEELLDSIPQTYYYYPYFRIKRISRRRNVDIPKHPLSNYADDYDRFPTVAWLNDLL